MYNSMILSLCNYWDYAVMNDVVCYNDGLLFVGI